MIKIEKIEVYGWEAAIRGMRNPMNSWEKIDTAFMGDNDIILGTDDLKLMKKLVAAGADHSKFMRMINASMDITAPLYWWKEFDTYKVGTVANSCSTMYKIQDKEFTLNDFSREHLQGDSFGFLYNIVDELNKNRNLFIETKDKDYWWQLIQLLPSSYNQKRTVQMNYQVAQHIYNTRKDHKLDEWRKLCETLKEELPYFAEICDIK